MTTIVSLRIPEAILKPLNEISEHSERPRTYLIIKALESYLDEYQDCQIAMERLRDTSDRIISPAELRKTLGV